MTPSMMGWALMMMAPIMSISMSMVSFWEDSPPMTMKKIQVATKVSVSMRPRFIIALGALELPPPLAFFTIAATLAVVSKYRNRVSTAQRQNIARMHVPVMASSQR